LWVKGEYYDDLAAAGHAARGTLDRDVQFSPFDRIDWFETVHEHGMAGGRPLVVRARTEGADAWLFMARAGAGRLVALAPADEAVFQPVYSGQPDDRTKRRLLRAVARRLRSGRPRIARVTLDRVTAHAAPLLTAALRRAGWLTVARPTGMRGSATLGDRAYDDYWQARPGRLRSLVDSRAGRSAVLVETASHADPAFWSAYETLGHASPALRALAAREAAAGTLRIGWASLPGPGILAAQIWTVEHGAAFIHAAVSAPDDDEAAAALLSATMFRQAIDRDEARLVLTATAADDALADWMDDRHPLWRIDAFNLRRPAIWGAAARAWLSGLVARRHPD
jgi:hypothetical protein